LSRVSQYLDYYNQSITNTFLIPAPVSWKLEPQDVKTSVGQSIEVRCEATGIPDPVVVISKKIDNQTSSSSSPVFKEVSRGSNSAFITFSSLSSFDSASFSCTAFNEAGSLKKDFRVYVQGQSLVQGVSVMIGLLKYDRVIL
jgi:hypothetical protein